MASVTHAEDTFLLFTSQDTDRFLFVHRSRDDNAYVLFIFFTISKKKKKKKKEKETTK